MLVSVVGCGTVGSAVAQGLESQGVEVRRYDPAKGYTDKVEGPVFICVYTANMKELESVVREYAKSPLVIIKTTMMPGTTEHLIDLFGDHVVYCPEFLCEKTALADFLNPDKVVIGTRNETKASALIDMFDQALILTPTEAEILKLAINSFYAVKVAHMNEVADLCEKHGADYERVRAGLSLDRFICNQHLDVWHGGYRGFGGKCLPKDSKMFMHACFAAGVDPKVVVGALGDNALRGQCYTS